MSARKPFVAAISGIKNSGKTTFCLLYTSSSYMKARRAMALKEKGLKFLIVDTRRTPASEKLADLFLQPRTGTDGALAHAIANVLIQNGWIDKPYIDKYVYGFDEYAEYVSQFNESNIEQPVSYTHLPLARRSPTGRNRPEW